MKIGGYLIYDKEKVYTQKRVMTREMYKSARSVWELVQYELECMNKEFTKFCEKNGLRFSDMVLLLDQVEEKEVRIHTRIHTRGNNCRWIGDEK